MYVFIQNVPVFLFLDACNFANEHENFVIGSNRSKKHESETYSEHVVEISSNWQLVMSIKEKNEVNMYMNMLASCTKGDLRYLAMKFIGIQPNKKKKRKRRDKRRRKKTVVI